MIDNVALHTDAMTFASFFKQTPKLYRTYQHHLAVAFMAGYIYKEKEVERK